MSFHPWPALNEYQQVDYMNTFLEKFPPTVDDAVDRLYAELSFADRTRLANMNESALAKFHRSYGIFIRHEFRLPGNDLLMASCLSAAYMKKILPEQASYLILKKLQERIIAGHSLKVVK